MSGTIWFLLVTVIAVRFGLGVSTAAWLAFGGLVWYRVLSILTDLEYRAVAARVYDVRQAKRLFGLIGTGEVVARIVGGFSVPFFVRAFGVVDFAFLQQMATRSKDEAQLASLLGIINGDSGDEPAHARVRLTPALAPIRNSGRTLGVARRAPSPLAAGMDLRARLPRRRASWPRGRRGHRALCLLGRAALARGGPRRRPAPRLPPERGRAVFTPWIPSMKHGARSMLLIEKIIVLKTVPIFADTAEETLAEIASIVVLCERLRRTSAAAA